MQINSLRNQRLLREGRPERRSGVLAPLVVMPVAPYFFCGNPPLIVFRPTIALPTGTAIGRTGTIWAPEHARFEPAVGSTGTGLLVKEHLYAQRHLVECCFSELKRFRRVYRFET